MVRRVYPNVYQLRLPPEIKSRIHDIFNVSQLRKYHSNTPLLGARETAAQPGDEEHEAQAMAPDEPDDVLDEDSEEVVMPDPEVPVAPEVESEHREPMRRRRQQFADRQVMRTLFVNYCEARERLEMAQEDFDVAHDNEDVMLRPKEFADACSALTNSFQRWICLQMRSIIRFHATWLIAVTVVQWQLMRLRRTGRKKTALFEPAVEPHCESE